MQLLDYFFTNKPQIEKFYPRKVQLPPNESFILYGARATGKSALITDYLNNINKKYLYIDCQDPAFILDDIQSGELNFFIKEEAIKLLVLDHYFEGFLDSFPNVEQLIIVSRDKLKINLPKFHLYPLDFEEFLNFKNAINIQSAFSLYTKFGTLPKVVKSSNFSLASKEIFFEKFDEQEGKVILVLALFQGKIATAHQIYQRAKENFKISKDWLYKAIKNFESEGLVYQIPTINSGFGKKIIIYDFAFSKYLNKYQQFITSFDTLVAMALIKHNFNIKASNLPLGYLIDNLTFVQLSPFDEETNFWQKAQSNFGFYSNLNIKNVLILTINSSYEFKIKNISFKALPFYEWVMGL